MAGSSDKLAKTTKNEKPINESLEGAICGAVAGFTCRMVIAPLDVLKIRFQVQRETGGVYMYRSMVGAVKAIVASEGYRALWKGNVAALLMASSYTAVQFGVYERILSSKQLVNLRNDVRSIVSGGTAAAVATLATYPLDLTRTRMAAEPAIYPTIFGTYHQVMSKFGVRGFYFGVAPTVFQIVPYMALNYTAYEKGKQWIVRRNGDSQMSTVEALTLGAASGTFAKMATLPLDNVKKRMQIVGQFSTSGPGYKNGVDALLKVFRKEGAVGLFRGAVPSLVKAAPSSAITFAAYEATKKLLRNRRISNYVQSDG